MSINTLEIWANRGLNFGKSSMHCWTLKSLIINEDFESLPETIEYKLIIRHHISG